MLTPDAVSAGTDVVLSVYSAIDGGAAMSASSSFTDDAVFQTASFRADGIGAIEQFLREREADTSRRTVHVLNNVRAASAASDHLELTGLLLVYAPGPDTEGWALSHLGGVRHVLRREDDQWRITARHPVSWGPA